METSKMDFDEDNVGVRGIEQISTEPLDLCITQLPGQCWARKKECM